MVSKSVYFNIIKYRVFFYFIFLDYFLCAKYYYHITVWEYYKVKLWFIVNDYR